MGCSQQRQLLHRRPSRRPPGLWTPQSGRLQGQQQHWYWRWHWERLPRARVPMWTSGAAEQCACRAADQPIQWARPRELPARRRESEQTAHTQTQHGAQHNHSFASVLWRGAPSVSVASRALCVLYPFGDCVFERLLIVQSKAHAHGMSAAPHGPRPVLIRVTQQQIDRDRRRRTTSRRPPLHPYIRVLFAVQYGGELALGKGLNESGTANAEVAAEHDLQLIRRHSALPAKNSTARHRHSSNRVRDESHVFGGTKKRTYGTVNGFTIWYVEREGERQRQRRSSGRGMGMGN
jgi:hypothetical protein